MLTNCKISTAKTAGFCFGVDRAVKIVYNKLDNRHNVVTLGPIIHNRNVVSDLEARGCRAVELSEVKKDNTVIIRSHGVGQAVYDALDIRRITEQQISTRFERAISILDSLSVGETAVAEMREFALSLIGRTK